MGNSVGAIGSRLEVSVCSLAPLNSPVRRAYGHPVEATAYAETDLGCWPESATVNCSAHASGYRGTLRWEPVQDSYLVDSASSHMLVSKIKPCMSKYKQSIR